MKRLPQSSAPAATILRQSYKATFGRISHKGNGYTDYYFTKKFRKETGVSLTDYIKQARIEYAKILLITTRTGIDEISDSLRFRTRNYFSKVFREIVGITPAAYRERMRKGELRLTRNFNSLFTNFCIK